MEFNQHAFCPSQCPQPVMYQGNFHCPDASTPTKTEKPRTELFCSGLTLLDRICAVPGLDIARMECDLNSHGQVDSVLDPVTHAYSITDFSNPVFVLFMTNFIADLEFLCDQASPPEIATVTQN